MKRVFIILLISFLNVYSQSSPIYVASLKGLSLRQEPSASSAKLEVLEYGTKITDFEKTSVNAVIDGYPGTWLKVNFSDGKSGYIFSGYTLPIEPPLKKYNHLEDYFTKIYGTPTIDSATNRDGESDYYVKNYYTYSNGMKYGTEIYYEWDVNYLTNVNLTIEQTYLWFYLIEEYHLGFHLSQKIDFMRTNFSREIDGFEVESTFIANTSYELTSSDGGTNYIRITLKKGLVLLEWGGGV